MLEAGQPCAVCAYHAPRNERAVVRIERGAHRLVGCTAVARSEQAGVGGNEHDILAARSIDLHIHDRRGEPDLHRRRPVISTGYGLGHVPANATVERITAAEVQRIRLPPNATAPPATPNL